MKPFDGLSRPLPLKDEKEVGLAFHYAARIVRHYQIYRDAVDGGNSKPH